MTPTPPTHVARIARLELQVCDLRRSMAFYVDALGFERLDVDEAAAASLALGGRELRLSQAPGPVPGVPAQADDPRFQHFAVVVRDMDRAHAHVAPRAGPPFSRGGPQRLPPRNGGVRAWKFRDPDGHPVELLELRTPEWRGAAEAEPERLFLGIDHTALACADLAASVAFYRALGLRSGEPSHNHGPAQDGLDGLDGVDLHIATLHTVEPGLHVELLHYASPEPPQIEPPGVEGPRGARSVTTVLQAAGEAAIRHDPDGHRLALTPG